MKRVDISSSVMKHIAQEERIRISLWFKYFIGTISILLTGFIISFVLIVQDLLAKKAFDLLELFSQDAEIISEFWQEALQTFLDEIPQNLLLLSVLCVVMFCIMIFITRKKRHQIQNKMKHLDKYS